MSLYDDFYPVAVELLAEFGADAILTSVATPPPTSASKRAGRVATTVAPQSRPARVFVGPVEVWGVDRRKTYPTRATMLAEPFEGDTLTMGSTSWTVGRVTRIAPQGQAIIFFAEVA